MIEEAVYVGVDVVSSALDVAVIDSGKTWQFVNDDEGISQTIHYIASVKPAGIILEVTGNLEMPLAKTDTIDARILALFGARVKPENPVVVVKVPFYRINFLT